MRYFIDDALLDIRPRSLLFVHTDQAHFLVEEDATFDMVVAVFASEMLDPQGLHPPCGRRAGTSADADPRSLSVDACDELVALADRLIGYDHPDGLELGLSWWLHSAWTHWQAAERGGVVTTHPAVARALSAIRNNPALPLDTIARNAGLSLSRLGQAFRKETGMTMRHYRTRQRLDLVDRSLRINPSLPLLTAAFDAGFGDYSSFYRACRIHQGRSPTEVFGKGASSGGMCRETKNAPRG